MSGDVMSLFRELQKSFLKRAVAKERVASAKRVADLKEIKELQEEYFKLKSAGKVKRAKSSNSDSVNGSSIVNTILGVGNFAAKMLESQDRFYAEDQSKKKRGNY